MRTSVLVVSVFSCLCACGDGDGRSPDTPASEAASEIVATRTPRADGPRSKSAEASVGSDGEKPKGKWGRFNTHRFDEALTDEQRTVIMELEALGYVAESDREAIGVMPVVPVWERERAFEGVNFFVSGHDAAAFLVDMEGRILHTWAYDFWDAWPDYPARKNEGGTHHYRRARVLPNGDVLAIFEGKGIIRMDKDSRLLWAVPNRAHHDLDIAGDNAIYTLTREAHLIPRLDPKQPIMEDFIVVLDSDGTETHRVSLIEAFERSPFDEVWRRKNPKKDLFHTNTVHVLDGSLEGTAEGFEAGNVLVSMRSISALAVVNMDEGVVVWAHRGSYRLQHDPRIVPGGRMLLFDNSGLKKKSRVLEFEVPTMDITWRYQGSAERPFHSATLGAAHRLPNGNTLVTESMQGHAFEVDADGDVVWEFFNPHRAGDEEAYIAALFEVIRLEPDFGLAWRTPPTPTADP